MTLIDHRPDMNLNAVVYGTDFSRWSDSAGYYALRLATYFSSKLFVAHAFTLCQAAIEVEMDHPLASRQRKHLQSLLCEKASLLRSHSIQVIPTLLDRDPKDVIPELADRHAPSIIALGTHGGGRIERGIIGSIGEQILRSTRWPTLTVGPHVPPSSTFPFERILYATDLSSASTHAAAYAVSFAEAFGAKLDVLNVVRRQAIDHPDRLSDLRSHFYDALDRLIPEHAREFCDARTFVDVGRAHDQILEHVRRRSIDLLVLGLRKTAHTKIEARASGAFQLMVDVSCPVVTITHE